MGRKSRSVEDRRLRLHHTQPRRLLLARLLNPGLFADRFSAPYRLLAGEDAVAAILAAPERERLRIVLVGTSIEGREVEMGVLLPLGPRSDSVAERLLGSGLILAQDDQAWLTTGVVFGSLAAKLLIEPGFKLQAVEVRADGPAREWVFVVALLLFAWVLRRQMRRRPISAATA